MKISLIAALYNCSDAIHAHGFLKKGQLFSQYVGMYSEGNIVGALQKALQYCTTTLEWNS